MTSVRDGHSVVDHLHFQRTFTSSKSRIMLTSCFAKPQLLLLVVFLLPSQRGASANGEETRPSIVGTVNDENGSPVVGAIVDISTAAPKFGPSVFCPSCYLDCSKKATTDEEGKFKIADLDPNLRFRLVVASPAFETHQTSLTDPASGPVDVVLLSLPADIAADRIVRGVVESEHGVAIPGALVSTTEARTSEGFPTGASGGISPVVTDSRGRFAVILPPNVGSIDVEVTAEGTSGQAAYRLVPGSEAAINVPIGASVVGRVVRGGEPVVGMTVAVAQTDRRLGEGRPIFIKAVGAVSDDDGNFRFDHLPPDQQYCIYSVIGEANRSQSDSVLATRVFNVPASGKTFALGDLEVTSPLSIRGKLTLEVGAKLEESFNIMLERDPAWDIIAFTVEPDGAFHANGLAPETYELKLISRRYVLNSEKIASLLRSERSLRIEIAKSVDDMTVPIKIVTATPTGEAAYAYEQTVSGVVTSVGGEPVAGIRVDASDSLHLLGKGFGDRPIPRATTGDDGRFSISNLPEIPVWLKLYRPYPDSLRSQYLGMIQPRQNSDDVQITVTAKDFQ